MAKISINGKNLHEIKMKLKGGQNGSVGYLLYPEHRINAEVKNKKIILHIPPLLTIAIFELIFQNNKIFPIKINNKEQGLFRIEDITYPDQLYDDGLVDINMEVVNKLKKSVAQNKR